MSELFFYLPGIFLILCQLWNELKLGVSFHKTHPFMVRSVGGGLEMHPTQWMVNNPDITVVAPQVPDFTSLTCFSHFATGMTMDPKDFTRVPEVVYHQSFPSGHQSDVTSFYCHNLGISSPNSRYHTQVGCLQIPQSPTTCHYTV